MNDVDIARRQRCRALQLAVVFGVLLPLFTRSWASLAAAVVGVAVALVVYWRRCRTRR